MSDDEFLDLDRFLGPETASEEDSGDEYHVVHTNARKRSKTSKSGNTLPNTICQQATVPISVNQIELNKIYWLTTAKPTPQFKNVEEQMMLAPNRLFEYLYMGSIEYLCEQTNIKYQQRVILDIDSGKRASYSPITIDEMKTYCGILMIMDIYDYPD